MYIKKHAQVSDNYQKIALGLVALAAIVLITVLYFSLGQAVVRVTSKITPLSTDFVADVAVDGGAAEALPGVLYETVVTGEKTGDATGLKIMEADTLGEVTLINKQASTQVLVERTRLLAENGVLLRLKNRVEIPAGGEITAAVYADDPNAFEVLAPTKFTVPGLWEGLQSQVYATSAVPLKSGGESLKQVKAIDITRTKDELSEELYAKAIAEFRAGLGGEHTVVVVGKRVLATEVNAEPEAVVDTFVATMKMEVTLIALDQNKIIELASGRLAQVVPDGMSLLNLDLDKFSYKVQNFDTVAKTANIKVHVEGGAVMRADNEIFDKEKIAGLSAKGVELYLSNYSQVEAVKVELSPFWVKEIPSAADKTTIIIENR